MKKVLLTILSPLWFFLAKTQFGCILMLVLIPAIPGLIIALIFHTAMKDTGESARSLARGLAMFGLLASPFIAAPLMRLGSYLESHYRKWRYRTW